MLATPSRLRGPGGGNHREGLWDREALGAGAPKRREEGRPWEGGPRPQPSAEEDGGGGRASSWRSVFNFPKGLGCSFPSLTAVEVRGTEEENALFILSHRRES